MRLFAGRPHLPLLMLCFNCLVAENGKFNPYNHDGTKQPRPLVETVEKIPKVSLGSSWDDSTANSPLAGFPCPVASAIDPCVCTVDSDDSRLNLDCTLVESEEQLAAVFQQDFPIKEFYEFRMRSNSAVRRLLKFLNGVTFENLILSPGPFALEMISDYFLLDLKDTVKNIWIEYSNLITETFPFLVLPAMNQLSTLRIIGSNMAWIPPIRAPNLSSFAVERSSVERFVNGTISVGTGKMSVSLISNNITTIEPGSIFFADEESATSSEPLIIDLAYNQIQSLQAGTFPIRNGEFQLSIHSSPLASIEPGTFVLPNASGNASYGKLRFNLPHNQLQSLQAGTFPFRNGHVTLIFNNNNISSIEPGTFVLPEATGNASYGSIYIDLVYNQLQSLQPGTFPLRNGAVTLYLFHNRISSIEPGTFVLPEATDALQVEVNLSYNELTTIDEAVFGDLMPFIIYLGLRGNRLTCGCDVVWLIQNATYMYKVDYESRCADGTRLRDLNPEDFVAWCLL